MGDRKRASDYVYGVLAPNAIGQIIGGFEALWSMRSYRPDGLLRGRAAERDGLGTASLADKYLPRCIKKAIDSHASAVAIHLGSVLGAGLILASPKSRNGQMLGVALSLATNQLAEYRNPYGRDGSDQMSKLIYSYRLATGLIPAREASDDYFLRAVNVQACIAYTASGLAKLISSTWRSGEALRLIVLTDSYGGTFFSDLISRYPGVGRAISWATIAWETAYPAIYLTSPSKARPLLILIKLFHGGIAVTMGLPRFFWGFSASHVAIEYVLRQRAVR